MNFSQAVQRTQKPALNRRHLNRSQRRNMWFFIFISPFLFGLLVLTIFPVSYGFYMSLTDYDGFTLEDTHFVGLANYQYAFEDPNTIIAFKQTLLWVAMNVPAWIFCSFGIAMLLNQNLKASGLFRTLFYLPTVIPAVGVITTWKIILDQNYGLLNGVLSLIRPGTAVSWLGAYVLQGVLLISIWSGLGWGMVVFLAGLQGIPNELVEAAKIDGAGAWRIFQHITFPLMTPVLFFQLVMSLISSFQQLLFPLLIGLKDMVPNVPRGIYFIMVHTWINIKNGLYGYGLALLWLLFVAVILLAVVVFWSERFWVYKGDTEESKP
jgi:multiple sugar transport system permease protein